MDRIEVPGTAPFSYDAAFGERLAEIDERVTKFRQASQPDAEGDLSRFLRSARSLTPMRSKGILWMKEKLDAWWNRE